MRSIEQMCSNGAMANHTRLDELRLLTKASKLYYEQGYTQQAIADYLRISRPKVSRLLQQARDEGIVNITVLSPQATPNTHIVQMDGGLVPPKLKYTPPSWCAALRASWAAS